MRSRNILLENILASHGLRSIFRIVIFITVLLAVNLIFFRHQIANGFTILFGDRFDGVIEVALLEHWFNVVRGLSNWSDVNYFYPHDNTLGYNDGYIIYGLIHSIFRGYGLDPFLSSEFVNIIVKSIGFVAFFAVCRQMFGLSFTWALFGATLFSLNHSSFLHADHAQLFSVSFAPVMALFMWESYRRLRSSEELPFIIWGSLSGIFFGVWALNSFYMAWFFVFFIVFLFAIILFGGGKTRFRTLIAIVRHNLRPLFIVGLVTSLALVPLLWIYLPKADETGMRSYEETLYFTLGFQDVFDVGADNLLFGKLYSASLKSLCSECETFFSEHTTAVAPILLIIFCCCCVWLLLKNKLTRQQVFLSGIALATLITWILCFRFNGMTGWYFIYHFFPGAQALRVVARYQIFLMFPIVILSVYFLAALTEKVSKPVIIILCSLLLVEEINTGAVGLDRAREIARIAVNKHPPKECHSFFVSGAPDQDPISTDLTNGVYPHNVSAMMIAQYLNIPTINGHASFDPPDWNFSYPYKADYIRRVDKYAAQNNISGLCRLDLATLTWDSSWWSEDLRLDCPSRSDFSTAGDVANIDLMTAGFSVAEHFGRWSDGNTAAYLCKLSATTHPTRIRILTRAFVPERMFITINQTAAQEYRYERDGEIKIIELSVPDNVSNNLQIQFYFPDAISPKELGVSEDFRKLGVGVQAIEIQ